MMGQSIELTNLEHKKVDQKGGGGPSKVRLTLATMLSLQNNRKNNKLDIGLERWNNKYMEYYNAVVSAEVAAAEQKVRDSIM